MHSFEPNPKVFPKLTYNAELNSFGCARISQLALSDSDGRAEFFVPKNSAVTTVGSLIQGFASESQPLVVEMMRFDTYCNKFSIAEVDLMKIDVEGAELKVLTGMGELFRKWRPDIICEVWKLSALPH